ncbi:uncharacterized protein LOC133498967 [Syngnathoides biaculeatus]|uniref:uncharacterized protein LOC133498967 n=1 Tax=Syngnathoides biaculeatus TaxID=300417 RepID=UPI002ADE6EDF|nr:uncharacterized protein LOC133498967 [Syngnathoides biaculeatus]
MVKRCSHGLCNSDDRYPERLVGGVQFVPFPKPKRQYEKCLRWIKLCGRPHDQLNPSKINRNRYVCTKHFVNQSQPSKEFPDPFPADPLCRTQSTRKPPSKRRCLNFATERKSSVSSQPEESTLSEDIGTDDDTSTSTLSTASQTHSNCQPAPLFPPEHPDGAPTLKLGHTKLTVSAETATSRHQRVVERRKQKRRQEAHGSASNDPNDHDYVPHVNMGYKTSAGLTLDDSKKKYQRVQRREDDKRRTATIQQGTSNAASILLTLSNSTGIHDPCLSVITQLQGEKRKLLRDLTKLQDDLKECRRQLRSCKFGDNFLREGNQDARTAFFTGVPNHLTFLWLVNLCANILPVSTTLTPASVLLMVLMKLRLNLADQDLAYRFNLSRQTVTEMVSESLPGLANKLAFLVRWAEKGEMIMNVPKIIKDTYKHCRVIIDCCEVFIDRPGNVTVQGLTWSNSKSHNTVKVLIAMSPVGAVMFVSKAFGGRVSDKVIAQRSGFLQLLEPGDLVLADRGFSIADDLAARGASLAVPAFTSGKLRLSPKEIETGRRRARVKIHVERAIDRVKNFKILSTTMRINLVSQFDNIMTICCALSNLHPKLL